MAQAPLLDIAESDGQVRLAPRREPKRDAAKSWLLIPALIIPLAALGALWAWLPAGERFSSALNGVFTAAIVWGGLWRWHPKPGEWIIDTRTRDLRRDGKRVARFEEVRLVRASSEHVGRQVWRHSITISVHRNRAFSDVLVAEANGAEDDGCHFQSAARLLAHATGAPLQET